MSTHVLLVSESSGGHFIPALEVAECLGARGISAQLWYPKRISTRVLTEGLSVKSPQCENLDIEPLLMGNTRPVFNKFKGALRMWSRSHESMGRNVTSVVVGFGGWVSAPVVFEAKRRGIPSLIHEQNAVLGKANRWLSRCADRLAVSFESTQEIPDGVKKIVTGLPIRHSIGKCNREDGANRYGLDPSKATLLVLGGSQGSRAVNQLVIEAVRNWTIPERRAWQILHVTGMRDIEEVKTVYSKLLVDARVVPYVVDMEFCYSVADMVIARSGASTIAEVARCSLPTIFIPYPHAHGHQRVNARRAELTGGAFVLEESDADPVMIAELTRLLMSNKTYRVLMGKRLHSLETPDAQEKITEAIIELSKSNKKVRARQL